MNKKLNCLICDDEPVARRILRNFVEQTPFLEVAMECENGMEAMAYLQNNEIDLLFLDINMPILTGLELLGTLRKRPKTILTTAYSEHALAAYDLDVVDYLVKPIPFERFLRAVQRAREGGPTITEEVNEELHLMVRFGRTIQKVPFTDILYLEAQANVVKIVTTTQSLKSYQTLHSMEGSLPPEQFVRTHRSFLVNKTKVHTIEGASIVFQEDQRVPISEGMREEVLTKLGFS